MTCAMHPSLLRSFDRVLSANQEGLGSGFLLPSRPRLAPLVLSNISDRPLNLHFVRLK